MAVLSRDLGRPFAAEHGVERACASLAELFADDGLDGPKANDPDGCCKKARNWAKVVVELGIGVQYRQHPAHQTVRDLVHRGALGTPVTVDATTCLPPMEVRHWYDDEEHVGGDVVPMSGVHRLSLPAFLWGRDAHRAVAPRRRSTGARDLEDIVVAALAFDGDVLATVRFAMDTPHGGDTIAPPRDSGVGPGDGDDDVVVGRQRRKVRRHSGRPGPRDALRAGGSCQRRMEGFHTGLRGEPSAVAGPAEGAVAVSVAGAIRKSTCTGRRVDAMASGIHPRKDTT